MADIPNFVHNEHHLVKGKVEKIFSTYGFIMDSIGKRQFFHFGKCVTRPESLHTGDMVEFMMGYDEKSGRYHAQKVRKIEFEEYLHESYNIPPVGNFKIDRSSTMLNLRNVQSTHLRRTNGGYALADAPSFKPPSLPLSSEFEIGQWGVRHGNDVANFPHPALVVQMPPDYAETAKGAVAFAVDGGIEMATFTWSSLGFPQERSLIVFGAQVTIQAKYNPSNGWEVLRLMPLADEYFGKVVSVDHEVAQIDVEGYLSKRVRYPLSFYTSGDVNDVAVGALVGFILVSSPTGEVASRLRLLVAASGRGGGGARLPFVTSASTVHSIGRYQSSPVAVPADTVLSESSSPPLSCQPLDDLPLSTITSHGPWMRMSVDTVGAISDEGDSASPSPSSSWGDAARRRCQSSPSLSPVASVTTSTRGFVASVLDSAGTRLLVETQDHSRVLLAKSEPGLNFKKNEEVSFVLASVDGQPGAVSIKRLPAGTLSAGFVLNEAQRTGRILKEITYGESFYEGVIESKDLSEDGSVTLQRYPFTVLSLSDVH